MARLYIFSSYSGIVAMQLLAYVMVIPSLQQNLKVRNPILCILFMFWHPKSEGRAGIKLDACTNVIRKPTSQLNVLKTCDFRWRGHLALNKYVKITLHHQTFFATSEELNFQTSQERKLVDSNNTIINLNHW